MISKLFIVLVSTTLALGQRGSFAGFRPIGYPEIIPTTLSPGGLGNRFGETETTTKKLPLEANGDRDLVDRLSKLPLDQQPFWLLNWQALENQRERPQFYPQRPNSFLDPLSQNNPNSGVAVDNRNVIIPNTDIGNKNVVLNSSSDVPTSELEFSTMLPNSNDVSNSNTGIGNSNDVLNSNTELGSSNGVLNSNTELGNRNGVPDLNSEVGNRNNVPNSNIEQNNKINNSNSNINESDNSVLNSNVKPDTSIKENRNGGSNSNVPTAKQNGIPNSNTLLVSSNVVPNSNIRPVKKNSISYLTTNSPVPTQKQNHQTIQYFNNNRPINYYPH